MTMTKYQIIMNSFIYNIPCKVYFGENQLENLTTELKQYGRRVLMVYGSGSIKKIGLYDKVLSLCQTDNIELFELANVQPNPRISSVREGAKICKEKQIDVVLAVGGGSTIDCAKWICAAACVEHDAWDFFNEKWAPVERALPLIDILTLTATGSEMDAGGVISNPETKDKIGRIASPLLPKVSFLDPTLTFSVNAYQTACGAADMMSHIMEVYFNNDDDFYMLDCFMEGMMKTIIKYTPIAINEPDNYKARAELMWTGSWAINGFINGGKMKRWSCHPMEHEISAIYDITHGLGLAILTPRWMKYCLNEKNIDKYVQFATNVFDIKPTADKMQTAKAGIAALEKFLFDTIKLVRTFPEAGIKDNSNFEIMAQKSVTLGGLQNAFQPLNTDDVVKIFEMCMVN